MSSNVQPYELKLRAIKKCIIKDLGTAPAFKAVYISSDIAAEIERTTACKGKVGVDTTWETIPLKVDPTLRIDSAVYIW